jgi:hypothetical protein
LEKIMRVIIASIIFLVSATSFASDVCLVERVDKATRSGSDRYLYKVICTEGRDSFESREFKWGPLERNILKIEVLKTLIEKGYKIQGTPHSLILVRG